MSYKYNKQELLLLSGDIKMDETSLKLEDNHFDIAVKILNYFDVGQQVTITKMVNCYVIDNPQITEKINYGFFVLKHIEDEVIRRIKNINKKSIIRKSGSNYTIGFDYSKVFRYHINSEETSVTIWRVK